MSSKRVVLVVLVGLLGGFALALIGLVIGADYGGNHATGFEFNGLKGYEATGQLGAVLGLVIGGTLGSFLAAHFTRRRDSRAT